MQVILLEKVQNLGDIGDKVNVKSGFARNFLLPQKKAVTANGANSAKFEQMRAELEKKAAEQLATAQSRAEAIAKLSVTVAAQTAEEGKLYGSVGPREIAEGFTKAGEEISKHEVVMSEGPIRMIGEHEVKLQLHSDVTIPVKVTVVAEE